MAHVPTGRVSTVSIYSIASKRVHGSAVTSVAVCGLVSSMRLGPPSSCAMPPFPEALPCKSFVLLHADSMTNASFCAFSNVGFVSASSLHGLIINPAYDVFLKTYCIVEHCTSNCSPGLACKVELHTHSAASPVNHNRSSISLSPGLKGSFNNVASSSKVCSPGFPRLTPF